jgi:hypothetical protein
VEQIRDEQYPWHRKKKTIIIVFDFDGCRHTFIDAGEPIDRHSALCLFI